MRRWAIALERWRAVKFGDDPTRDEVSERVAAYVYFAKAVAPLMVVPLAALLLFAWLVVRA